MRRTAAIAMTAACGLALGAWAYLDMLGDDRPKATYDAMHAHAHRAGPVAASILTGFVARRIWVLLAPLGPIAALAYLKSTGHRGPDGIDPLTSAPGIASLFWFAVLLLIGV